MENAKRLMSVFLSVLMFLSCLVVVPLTVNAVSSYTMPLNSTNLKSVGAQDHNGVACSCFALAYCRTILDGKAHSFSEYNKYGNSQTNVDCIWGNGNATKRTANSAKAVLKACYDYVNSNTPVVIHVNTSTGQHWVAVVGYQNVSDSNNMSYNNLIIIDPWYGYPQKKNGYSIHSDYAYVTPNDKGVSAHTHNYNTYVYCWKAHPHYKCYKCSCGEVKENKNEPTIVADCADCVKSFKATLNTDKSTYIAGENVTVSWNSITNATHYNLWLYRYKDDGTVERVFRNDLIKDTKYTYNNLSAGKYYTYFNTYTSNVWMSDGSDYFHSQADKIEFEVLDPVNFGQSFYARIAPTISNTVFTDYNNNLALYTKSEDNNQVWRFIRQTDSSYMIYNVATGNYIDLDGSNTANLTNIKTFQKNDVSAQHWYIIKNGEGYSFVSKCSSKKAIDINNYLTIGDGTNLQIYDSNLSVAQRFTISLCDEISLDSSGGTLYSDESMSIKIDGVNSGRGSNQLIIYTSGFGKTTNSNAYGKEISFNADGKFVAFRDYGATTNLSIPTSGFVASEHFSAAPKAEINKIISEGYKYAYVNYENNSLLCFKSENDYLNGLRKFVEKTQTYGTLATPTRDGYTFDGWYTSASGGTKITSSTAFTGTTTLYAHWTKIEEPTTAPATTIAPTTETQTSLIGNKTAYLSAASYTTGDEDWYAYTWNDMGCNWIKLENNVAKGLLDNVIFARINKSAKEPSWAAVWNQTEDLTTIDGGTFVVSSWNNSNAKLGGSWIAPETTSSPIITETPSVTETTEPITETAPTITGDVTRDGGLDVRDSTAIKRSIAKIITLSDEQMVIADVNKDGGVDVRDATLIQRAIARITEL